MNIPVSVLHFMSNFSDCVTRPTLARLAQLFVARVLTFGNSTVTGMARLFGKNPYNCAWHKVLSRYRISMWPLAFILIELIIKAFGGSSKHLTLVVDDTTCLHKGERVFGRGRHRDAVRSSQSICVQLLGHKWVVVSLIVNFAGSRRDWALPVAVGLYRSADGKTRHKTPAHIARLLIVRIARKFSSYSFTVLGDQGFGQHESARTYAKQGIVLVSKFYADAVLHSFPTAKKKGQMGRPRKRGQRLRRPEDEVKSAKRLRKATVCWYGGGVRRVKMLTGTGLWHRKAHEPIEVRWVYVRDITGTHRDEYLLSTDVTMTPEAIVNAYMKRWAIEVTFQECKAHLKLEKTRVWTRQSVLTLVPLLFATYSAVVLLSYDAVASHRVTWPTKATLSFSDMLVNLRRNIWKTQRFWDTLGSTRRSNTHQQELDIVFNALSQVA